VARFADRMVAAGYVSRDDEPGNSDAVTLELSAPGEDLVGLVTAWRERELARIFGQLPLAERAILTHALRELVEATGEGYGAMPVPDASAT
jgi:DNA-binding MarR family transcriptional regulator